MVRAFRQKVATNPLQVPVDPYTLPVPSPPSPDSVCALKYDEGRTRYRLQDFESAQASADAGFIVTHAGSCGSCSTLVDLALYIEKPDLTAPVRECAVTSGGPVAGPACLERLGFSPACARTWYFNAMNTRRECFWVCLGMWVSAASSNLPNGQLHECLACDEARSGPAFKASAGRTRRNSGLRSSIDRADSEVFPIVHDYE